MCKMGGMHIATGRKNNPLPLATPPPFKIPTNLYVKQLQQKGKFNSGMETSMIICNLSFVSYS